MWNRSTSSVVLAALLLAGASLAQPAGEPRAIARAWAVFDARDMTLSASLPRAGADWFAAVRVGPGAPLGAPRTSWAELTDGQRLPGRLAGASGEGVTWRSARLGVFELAWAESAALRLGAEAPAEPGLRLVNGDEANGEVRVSAEGASVASEALDVAAAWDRVASVRLRESAGAPSGLAVWLRDGGVVAARSVRENARGAGVMVELADGRFGQFERDEVLAATRGGGGIEPLGEPMRGEGLERRESGWLARAPAVGSWRLAGDVVGVVGSLQSPADSRDWSSVFASAWADRELLWSVQTAADRPAAPVASPVESGLGERELRLSVQPGESGRAGGVVELWLVVVTAP